MTLQGRAAAIGTLVLTHWAALASSSLYVVSLILTTTAIA